MPDEATEGKVDDNKVEPLHDGCERSESPVRPPISPITPEAQLDGSADGEVPREAQDSLPEPRFMTQPASVPFSESDNPDAVALRAAISVLQLQRDKSKQDIETLRQLKESALKQPELFTRELLKGKLQYDTPHSDPLAPTFEHGDSGQGSAGEKSGAAPRFPKIPTPQNVFRCPPVNWAKYNVVGEPLDKMHENQRARPSAGVNGEDPRSGREPQIAAPYSPFQDDQNLRKSP